MYRIFPTVARCGYIPRPPESPARPLPQDSADHPTRAGEIEHFVSSDILKWETLPQEIREHIACRMTAKGLATFSSTSKSNLALARSPQVIIRQRADEATRSLWHLARIDEADVIDQLLKQPGADRLDWNGRNAEGATLLMMALRHFSNEVIDALTDGPVGLFAGVDDNGDNVLHYAVERADAPRLDRMLTIHPLLAGYVDLPNQQRCTPLGLAYQKHEDVVMASLSNSPIDVIDSRIDSAQASLRQDAVDGEAPTEGLAQRIAAQVAIPPLTHVFPFDREGIPSEASPAAQRMPHFPPVRQPAQSRIRLAFRAINDRESATLEHVLKCLPTDILRNYRDNLIRAVLNTAHFPSVRFIARLYGEQMFAPLINSETTLHLAASQGDVGILEWLLRRDGIAGVLLQPDVAGRTPILRAAEHGQISCIETLARHYPAGAISDQDRQGHGLLRTLFMSRPASAIQFLYREEWTHRITPDDNTATLACAMRQVLAGQFDPVSVICDQDFLAHLSVIAALLARPRGQIDVRASIAPNGAPLIDVFRSGHLSAVLQEARRTEQQTNNAVLGTAYLAYDNDESLALALSHL